MEAIEKLELGIVLARIITVWITVLVLYLLYRWKFYKPMNEYLERRQKVIKDEVADAKKAKEAALLIEKEANDKLKEAREDARRILGNSKNEAIKVRDDIISKAKIEAKEKVVGANIEIEREVLKAKKELENEVMSIAMLSAQKILNEEIDEAKNEKLVEQFIKELNN